jgi:hypothetical protein
MPTDLTLLAAQYALDVLDVDSLKDIAIQAVCDGIDGRSMVYLAGKTTVDTPAELRELFVAALREHGQPIPSRLDAVKRIVRDVAARVAEGRIAPSAGASEMFYPERDLSYSLGDASDPVGQMLGVQDVLSLSCSFDQTRAYDHAQIDAGSSRSAARSAASDFSARYSLFANREWRNVAAVARHR